MSDKFGNPKFGGRWEKMTDKHRVRIEQWEEANPPRENYRHKNGVMRNLWRYWDEWCDWRDYRKGVIDEEQGDSHDRVSNWFVELCRFRPWLAGHLWRNSVIVLVLAVGGAALL